MTTDSELKKRSNVPFPSNPSAIYEEASQTLRELSRKKSHTRQLYTGLRQVVASMLLLLVFSLATSLGLGWYLYSQSSIEGSNLPTWLYLVEFAAVGTFVFSSFRLTNAAIVAWDVRSALLKAEKDFTALAKALSAFEAKAE